MLAPKDTNGCAWENRAIPLASEKCKGGNNRELERPGEIYKSKVELNFSLLDVVARITTRTMTIAAYIQLERRT